MKSASENVPPEGVLCQWLREEIDRKEPNKGCANTYKSSLRKYMRFFYGHDENGVAEWIGPRREVSGCLVILFNSERK